MEQARECGFHVLSAAPASVESAMAYACLADLLRGVDTAGLPDPQRLAIDRVLLRGSADGGATDQRAVAAALVSVVESLALQSPVLMAIVRVKMCGQAWPEGTAVSYACGSKTC